MTSARWMMFGVVGLTLAAIFPTSPARAGAKRPVELIQAQTEMPEESLLDVGIQVFDSGLPEDQEALSELESKGVFAEVRKSEARYIPLQLKQTLGSTGYWGAVRLVPEATVVDLMVTGEIRSSTGKDLKLTIGAVDATGKVWLTKVYEQEADPGAYKSGAVGLLEPYQSLYNRIANDLLEARQKRDDEEIDRLHTVSQLRFAKDLAPTAFADYLKVDKKGRYHIERLPPRDDPMAERLARIRERDHMFIDALNEHYADFYSRMDGPYDNWRAYSYEEQIALEKLRRDSLLEKILGAAAIVGGIYSSTKGEAGRDAGEVAILGGILVIQDGMRRAEEAKMNLEALRELGESLDADVAPILLDVEGEVMRLTGSVETQYATWRQLLRQIFATETGLPINPNTEVVGVKEPTTRQ